MNFSNRLWELRADFCFYILLPTLENIIFLDRKWDSWCWWRSHSNNHLHQPIEDSTDKLDSQPWGIWFEFPRSYIFHRVSRNSIFIPILNRNIWYFSDELGPDESIEHVVNFTASRAGTRNLIVDIDSNEQPDFQNSAVLTCN